jgi:Tfp pilus assembly protein PilF
MKSAACLPLPKPADPQAVSSANELAALKDWCVARADDWYAQGDLGFASDFLQHAAEIDPRDAQVWIALGSLRYELGQFEPSAQAFLAAARLEPLKARAFLHLAIVHGKLGQAEHAEKLFRHALVLEPENALAMSLLGHFLNGHGREVEGQALLAESARRTAGPIESSSISSQGDNAS